MGLRYFFHPIHVNTFNNRKFYKKLKRKLGFSPRKIELYYLAFVHRSASVEQSNGGAVNNERLEYLGDAVIDMIVADFLFKSFPERDEGFLTQMRSKIVKREQLNKLAIKMKLNELIVSQTSAAIQHKHINGNTLEALIGAIYLDKGYKRARKFFITKILSRYLDLNLLVTTEVDFKSRLIEWGQKNKQEVFFGISEEIDEENGIIFVSKVKVGDQKLGKGKGFNKKQAQQQAAKEALEKLAKDFPEDAELAFS